MQKVRVLATVPELETKPQLLKQIQDLSPHLEVAYQLSTDDKVTADALRDVEVLYTQRPPAHLDNANQLKWIQFSFTGVDKMINRPFFDPDRGIIITTGAGAHAGSVAEYCLAAMGLLSRDFLVFYKDQQSKVRDRSHSHMGDLHGNTLGVIGYGNIGREVGRLAHNHHMKILALSRRPDHRESSGMQWPDVGDPHGVLPERYYGPDQLHEMLAHCDFVVSSVPLTPETENLISDREFAAMKPSAYFVHVGRGRTLDDMALARALEQGEIAGAAVDVFRTDPEALSPEHPLWAAENFLLTPHISGNRNELYFQRMNDIICENLRRYLDGRPLLNVATRDSGY